MDHISANVSSTTLLTLGLPEDTVDFFSVKHVTIAASGGSEVILVASRTIYKYCNQDENH